MKPKLALAFGILAMALGGCFAAPKLPGFAGREEPPAPPAWKYKEISLKGTGTDAFVIMYHDVVEKRSRDTLWYDATAEEIKEQTAKLQEWGATFISLEDLYQGLINGKPLPPRAVAITYDDNYQGFYDHAWPIYKEQKIPVTMFVHTGFIGSTQGRPKMTKETLKELLASGHFSVGSHTITHPEDLGKLTFEQQTKELVESRALLEKEFGVEVRDIAWPVGTYNQDSLKIAKDAGYRMAFTMESGPAWNSPSALQINRYNPTKLDKAMEDAEKAGENPVGYVHTTWANGPVVKEEGRFDRVPLVIVKGGTPKTVLVSGRESVSNLVETFGGAAGINGGFFQIAAIASTDNRMIGPCLTDNVGVWEPDMDPARLLKLAGRPLVVIGDDGITITPFRSAFNEQAAVEEELGPVKNVFVAGAWLVHQGKARSREEIMSAATSDAMDFRRRAIFGYSATGELMAAACLGSFDSARLAVAAAEAGFAEAVLLDSGFSTSLVIGKEILASGHSTKAQPSRPVPHAIIIMDSASSTAKSDEGVAPADDKQAKVGP